MTEVIAVFDPSAGSTNLGDQVIVDSCIRELYALAPNAFIYRVALHQQLTKKIRMRVAASHLAVVAGSNMLNTRINHQPSLTRWRFSLKDALLIGNVTLMGVGWNKSSDWVNPIGSHILRRAMSKITMQSVRDEGTLQKAKKIGVENALNTSCPTLWRVPGMMNGKEDDRVVSRSVVTTLTFNEQSPVEDAKMLRTLTQVFSKVYFWPQGGGDAEYLRKLGFAEKVVVIQGSLEAYDTLLEEQADIVFIGTRLHGGIRALQKGRVPIIISIDHRAPGVAGTAGIQTLSRSDIDLLPDLIDSLRHPVLSIPIDKIEMWRDSLRSEISKNMV